MKSKRVIGNRLFFGGLVMIFAFWVIPGSIVYSFTADVSISVISTIPTMIIGLVLMIIGMNMVDDDIYNTHK